MDNSKTKLDVSMVNKVFEVDNSDFSYTMIGQKLAAFDTIHD